MTMDKRQKLRSMYSSVVQKQQDILRVAEIKAQTDVPDIPVPMKTVPMDHQKKAFAVAKTIEASAMIMDPGTGKTYVAIAAAGYRYMTGEIKKVVVIAPPFVVPVWKRQFEQHADFPIAVTLLNEKSVKEKATKLREINLTLPKRTALQIIVCNYESAWREPLLSHLKSFIKKDTMVILDESHKIKHHGAKQSKMCHSLGTLTDHKLILTGTPVTQAPLDFFSQYKFLNAEVFGGSWPKFREHYCIMGGFCNHEIIRYKNLDELARRAHSIAFRVTKAECLDLPPVVQESLCAPLVESLPVYQKMEKDFIVWLQDAQNKDVKVTAPVVIAQILRLQQIAGGFLPIRDPATEQIIDYIQIGSEKLRLLQETLEGIPKGQKTVTFCRFTPELRAIIKLQEDMGKKVLSLSGATPNAERGSICDQFQNDKTVDAIVVNIQTGGLGIDLFAAPIEIFYSMNYSYADYIQAIARVDRKGQTADKVTIYNLIAEGTIDEKILEAVQKKGNVAQLIVDDMKGKYEVSK